jgi:leucyl-tRNA synthetase
VQVNGKLRDRVTLPMGISEADIEQAVMAREKVRANLEGKEVVRFIHVAGRLVNVVVR